MVIGSFSELTLFSTICLQDGEIMSGISGLGSDAYNVDRKHYNCYHVLFLVRVSMFQYKSGCLLSFQKFWYFKFRLFNVPILLFEEH
jgi:hypothetical protein